MASPGDSTGFAPLAPCYKVEHAFPRLGWRAPASAATGNGTEASAHARLEVASLAYLFARLRVEPA